MVHKIIVFAIVLVMANAFGAIDREEFERRLGNVIPLAPIAEHIGDNFASIDQYKKNILQSRDETKLLALESGKLSYFEWKAEQEAAKKLAVKIILTMKDSDLDDPAETKKIIKALVLILRSGN